MSGKPITHLFTDLGGVLLSNGWDRALRHLTAGHFGLDSAEMDERHHLTYDTYESGKMGLAAYLDRVIFYQPRTFTHDDVIAFILGQAHAFPEMIDLVCRLKARHGIKVAVVSNEGREVTADRIRRFRLDDFVDFFIVSAFVHFRKPDEDIFRIALDIAQAEPRQVAYIEDRPMFVEVAAGLGLHAIWHQGFASTRDQLAALGLTLDAQGDGKEAT
ncbi:MAG: HAD-IA family hydrolase [Acidobacteria bacterium]|nr:HAD-IA family hydrolase [Acidobacteriota bacterium]